MNSYPVKGAYYDQGDLVYRINELTIPGRTANVGLFDKTGHYTGMSMICFQCEIKIDKRVVPRNGSRLKKMYGDAELTCDINYTNLT